MKTLMHFNAPAQGQGGYLFLEILISMALFAAVAIVVLDFVLNGVLPELLATVEEIVEKLADYLTDLCSHLDGIIWNNVFQNYSGVLPNP